MAVSLHYHPLSSYCWKVLIALYENEVPFEARTVNLGDPAERAAFVELWPTGKIPLLIYDGRVVPETSLQIEYLDRQPPGRQKLIPEDFEARLNARLWDRLFDNYVMRPMQGYVAQVLRPEAQRDAAAVASLIEELGMAYDLIERRMGDGPWAAGADFTMADCAAAPALFYACIVRPFPPGHARLQAYFERLLARPSVWRCIVEARPYFQYYPLKHALPARFLAEA